MNDNAYFHPYEGGPPVRAATRSSSVGTVRQSSHHHARSASDFSYNHSSHYPMMEAEEEPMEILYESQISHAGQHRHHSEPTNTISSVSNLELQVSMGADHLLALLQREANDYSAPLPIVYYPTEFAEPNSEDTGVDNGGKKGTSSSSSKKPTVGPWRKRIASWMYDVVDHFQYDRNVVSIALRYIDQYVSHLLVENSKSLRRSDSGIGASRGSSSSSSAQPIKRRHFQLIAVTSLYLAIKVHGELMENDPVSGAEYDVVASLIHEVDGRLFLGKPISSNSTDNDDTIKEEEEDILSQESDDDLRAVANKISDLKRRHRKGRWSMQRLSQFGLPLGHPNSVSAISNNNPNQPPRVPKHAHSTLPFKPRKRGMLSGPLRLHSFVELSRGLFTASDIIETEKKILQALNYVVNPPTSRRFVGELLRLLALAYCSVVDGESTNTEATASAAERILGLERKEILKKVLTSACTQIEGAASVPSLSIGCLPSVLAYGAVVNAVEEEFEKIASAGGNEKTDAMQAMEMEKNGSPQLEDFQRHYRRYSRNQSPTPSASTSNLESDKELFLEAWKEQFLVTVFHATNCFMSPDSQDIFKVRELLLDQVKDTEDTAASSPSSTTPGSSPTEGSKLQEGAKKRSPRSPRSVMIAGSNPRMLRGGSSFFSRQSSSSSNNTRLLSPYDSRGRTTASASSVASGNNAGPQQSESFRSLSGSSNVHTAQHRAYYKQTSEPIAEASTLASSSGRFARAQTPDISHFRNQTRQTDTYESWRSTGEAFQPPNPNPPFFSA